MSHPYVIKGSYPAYRSGLLIG